jgi:Ca2+-binding EF-hand superfamily protein
LNKVRDQLNKKGAETIRSTGKFFRGMSTYDGKSKVTREEFTQWFKELGVSLHKLDIENLLSYFDKSGEGYCNFEEFLSGIRGKPNQRRQAIVDKAFLKFDKEGNGVIDVTEIRQVFNCAKHPKVVSGEMSEEQVFATFLKNFNDVNGQGKIDRKEWNDYYSAVSYSIDNDDHFVILMKTAWNLE